MPVYKEGNTYTVRVYVDGVQIKRRGFETRELAKKAEAHLLLEKPKRRIKVSALMDAYYADIRSEIKHTTYEKYLEHRKYFDEWFGNKYVDQIDYHFCSKIKNTIPENFSVSYKNRLLRCAKQIFNYGVMHNYLDQNPFALVKGFKETERKEMNTWTLEQYKKFSACIEDETMKLFFDTLYWTGMRFSEARGLQWKHIDFKNQNIIIKQQAYKSKEIITLKSINSDRYIEIDNTLIMAFKRHLERCKKYDGFSFDWFVFGALEPPKKTTIQKVFYDAEAKSGMPHIRIHDLRHSHASYLIEQGISIMYISKRLGHSNVGVTMKTYSHLLDSLRKTEAAKIRKLHH